MHYFNTTRQQLQEVEYSSKREEDTVDGGDALGCIACVLALRLQLLIAIILLFVYYRSDATSNLGRI